MGGRGHCLFEGRYPKQNYRPPVLCYHSPLSLSLLVYNPLFLRHQRKAYCYYCCYRGLPPVDIIFSCPHTIILIIITVAKTHYSPNRKCPSDSPPPESSWVRDSPPFSSLQPQLRESVLQWAPKTRMSALPPPPGGWVQEFPKGRGGGRGGYCNNVLCPLLRRLGVGPRGVGSYVK